MEKSGKADSYARANTYLNWFSYSDNLLKKLNQRLNQRGLGERRL